MTITFKTKTEVFESLKTKLQTNLPNITDYNAGSVARELLQTIADELGRDTSDETVTSLYQELYEKYLNQYLETASGEYLDKLVALTGVTRLDATKATGEVRFTKSSYYITNNLPVDIPKGTKLSTVATANSPAIEFQTTETNDAGGTKYTIPSGVDYADIDVEATNAGLDGNVNANTITVLSTSLSGISSVNNPDSTSGGTDEENDDDLRSRAQDALQALAKATIAAIRAACLSISGVQDVSIQDLPNWNVYSESHTYSNGNLLYPLDKPPATQITSNVSFNIAPTQVIVQCTDECTTDKDTSGILYLKDINQIVGELDELTLDGVNHFAWYKSGETDKTKEPVTAWLSGATAFDSIDYTSTRLSDNVRFSVNSGTGLDQYGMILMKFAISQDETQINKFKELIEGYSYDGSSAYGITAEIWNENTSSWEVLSSHTNPGDANLEKEFTTNITDYIISGYIYIQVYNTTPSDGIKNWSVYVDYAYSQVTEYKFEKNTDYRQDPTGDNVEWLISASDLPKNNSNFYVDYVYTAVGRIVIFVTPDTFPLGASLRQEIEDTIDETRAAGILFTIQSPLEVFIDVNVTIYHDGSNSDVETEVQTALNDYIENLSSGQDVRVNQAIEDMMSVDGMVDLTITNWDGDTVEPFSNISIDADEIARPGTINITAHVVSV